MSGINDGASGTAGGKSGDKKRKSSSIAKSLGFKSSSFSDSNGGSAAKNPKKKSSKRTSRSELTVGAAVNDNNDNDNLYTVAPPSVYPSSVGEISTVVEATNYYTDFTPAYNYENMDVDLIVTRREILKDYNAMLMPIENGKPSEPSTRYSTYMKKLHGDASDQDVDVVFIVAPTLNQIPASPNNVRSLQQNINELALYLHYLSRSTTQSIKEYFMYKRQGYSNNALDYKECMLVLKNFHVNRANYMKFSDLVYNFYVSLIQNLNTFAHILVNVNYTHNRTNASQVLTYFINQCVGYIVDHVTDLLSINDGRTSNRIDLDMQNHIEQQQISLTSYYNYNLVNLQAHKYYKFTPDNDDNPVEQYKHNVTAENKIYSIKLFVIPIDTSLKF
ncbi:Chch42-like peptide [Clanis bilineata nucleopolyhedrovirus]|uniref:Chch42-like peptide n=1 Tax=Clanis bilineata nucleopolyhedrovirus TaxID=1307957 RepID=Q0N462_9ABAC|nr:Chch42-like peptide [Clanis bilineata nucleopolyhedrovirus]ABF47381.1 Chch42-like peptide [Clanis bilineata nucleopolyhedrovirus]